MTNLATGVDIAMRSVPFHIDTEKTGPLDMAVQYAAIGDPDKLLLTGLGETDVAGIAGRLAECGISGLAVASLVCPPVGGRMNKNVFERSIVFEQSVVNGTRALIHDITGNGHGVHQAIGVSEGGSQLLVAASNNPELYGQVVAIAPLINSRALGDNPREQTKELIHRFGEAGLKVDTAGKLTELMGEVAGGLALAKYQDPAEVFTALEGKLKIYIGEDDVVVPPDEAEAEVGEDTILRLPGMDHPTLLNEAGCYQAALIMQAEYTAGVVV